MRLFLDLLALVRALSADRARLALENVVLRQQLNVLKRSVKRARINDGGRMFWGLMHRLFADWKEHLVVVKPETVIRWHRRWFATTGNGSGSEVELGSREGQRGSALFA